MRASLIDATFVYDTTLDYTEWLVVCFGYRLAHERTVALPAVADDLVVCEARPACASDANR